MAHAIRRNAQEPGADHGARRIGAETLYSQVKSALTERISRGEWRPGQRIPSEFEIAADLGVSQGTVRKALDALARDAVVVRRQGRGTFVAEHTPQNVLFRFFNLFDVEGRQIEPDTSAATIRTGVARPEERLRLGLDVGDKVIRIDRLRTHDGRPLAVEHIVVPLEMAPSLAQRPVPNTLYDHYQRVHGITIAAGEERITAVGASGRVAERLEIEDGAPILRIDRTMMALDGQPVEWRVSLCRLGGGYYLARLK